MDQVELYLENHVYLATPLYLVTKVMIYIIRALLKLTALAGLTSQYRYSLLLYRFFYLKSSRLIEG